MDSGLSQNSPNWSDLYVGALFETHRAKLAARIAEARAAIVYRARDLFRQSGDHIEEGQALDDALYALEALAHCYFPENGESAAA
jgi:hypothetical protein